MRGLAVRNLGYGPVRLWGSVAFILANMAGGVFLSALGGHDVIWVIAAAMAATAVATLPLPRNPAAEQRPAGKLVGGGWRSALFVTVALGASLIQASHAVLYGFATLQWSAKGFDGSTIGLLWATGVGAEILLFAASSRWLARIGAIDAILVGGPGGVLRWSAMAFDPPASLLVILQCLHALSFGATHIGAMQVLSSLARDRGPATLQGDFSALQGVTFAAAMALSGMIVERLGSQAYALMALLAAGGVVIAFAGRRKWRETHRF
jgi:PPP family 3-phenylpropionic acid transporter